MNGTPEQNCPPIPSPTAVQSVAVGKGAVSGVLTLTIGPSAISLTYGFDLQDVQAQLNLYFPGAVVMGTAPTSSVDGLFQVYFNPDPLALFTVSSTLAITGTGGSPGTAVVVTVAGQKPPLYPNYSFLIKIAEEFVLTADLIPAFESRLIDLKLNVIPGYVKPARWGKAYAQGVFLMMAHIIKLSQNPVGFMTTSRAKNLQESYTEDRKLDGTVYGQQFRRLRNSTIIPIVNVGAESQMGIASSMKGNSFDELHDPHYQPPN